MYYVVTYRVQELCYLLFVNNLTDVCTDCSPTRNQLCQTGRAGQIDQGWKNHDLKKIKKIRFFI